MPCSIWNAFILFAFSTNLFAPLSLFHKNFIQICKVPCTFRVFYAILSCWSRCHQNSHFIISNVKKKKIGRWKWTPYVTWDPMDNWDWNFITGKLITNFPSESLCAAWLIQKNVGLMAFNCKLVCCNARWTKTIMVWGFALSFIWQNDTNFITTDTGDSNNKKHFHLLHIIST